MNTKKPNGIRDLVIKTPFYIEGVSFTAARVVSQIPDVTKSAVSSALANMVHSGQLSVISKKRKGGYINVYTRKQGMPIELKRAWVKYRPPAGTSQAWL